MLDGCTSTSTCPKQDVRYPKPGIKEISGGESALYQHWHIPVSKLKYSSAGYIVCTSTVLCSSNTPCFRVCLLPRASISWRENSLGVTAELGKNSAYATGAHFSTRVDFSYLAAQDYELLPIMDLNILEAWHFGVGLRIWLSSSSP